MYERYYGFAEKPFEIAPDPRFLFLTPSYRELLASLIYGVTQRKGLIALVGEVGTGKTLMINALKERLDLGVKVATIVNPDLTFKQMLNMVLFDLGVIGGNKLISIDAGLHRLQRFSQECYENSGNVVIVINEAQNLRNKTMESLRMLSNVETSNTKLIQMIFSGQTELDRKLKKPEWRQMVQRISIKRRSTQLTYDECSEYIQHRLAVAGYTGVSPFSAAARNSIYNYSEGIPRKVNILCDNALLIGYGLGRKTIDPDIVEEAVSDLDWLRTPPKNPKQVVDGKPEAKHTRARSKDKFWGPRLSFAKAKSYAHPMVIVVTFFSLIVGLTMWGWGMANR